MGAEGPGGGQSAAAGAQFTSGAVQSKSSAASPPPPPAHDIAPAALSGPSSRSPNQAGSRKPIRLSSVRRPRNRPADFLRSESSPPVQQMAGEQQLQPPAPGPSWSSSSPPPTGSAAEIARRRRQSSIFGAAAERPPTAAHWLYRRPSSQRRPHSPLSPCLSVSGAGLGQRPASRSFSSSRRELQAGDQRQQQSPVSLLQHHHQQSFSARRLAPGQALRLQLVATSWSVPFRWAPPDRSICAPHLAPTREPLPAN